MTTDPMDDADSVRHLVRGAASASLATRLPEDGAPYASLVLLACDMSAQPILFLSDLAEHSRNIAADPRVSVLVDGTAGLRDRLAGARVTLQGTAEPVDDEPIKARYLRRHPSASIYADFADFRTYRVTIARAHLVAGFGRIAWIDGGAVALPAGDFAALRDAEPGIVEHMNADHADAMADMARHLRGSTHGDWRMAGVDPEGCDLIDDDGSLLRLPFDRQVNDPQQCRAELVRLTRRARAAGTSGH